MDEIERPQEVGEVVTPEEESAPMPEQSPEEKPARQSHEDNRRFQAARLGGERSGYERAMRELQAMQDSREASERQQMEFIAADAEAFARRYPEVDLARLDEDRDFRRFCGSRYGREPISELYEDYLDLTGRVREAAAFSAESKTRRATGSGGGSGGVSLTAAQQRSLDEWNRAFPDMKMTAKEFQSR